MIRETIVTMVEPGGKIHIALIGITADGDHSLPFQGRAIAYGRKSRVSERKQRECSGFDSVSFRIRFRRLWPKKATCDCPAFQGRHELAFVNRDGLESTRMSERKCSATPKAG
jgi:hypothetical protein